MSDKGTIAQLKAVEFKEFSFTKENQRWVEMEIAKYPQGRESSAVVALLWRAQQQCGGWLPQKAIEYVADRLGMSYIRVYEIATFYTMFSLKPVGRYFIQLCGTVPCHIRGNRSLKDYLLQRVGPEKTVTEDGMFSWVEVECLGACCNAPVVQINEDYYEDLDVERLETLLNAMQEGKPFTKGSQIGRKASEPEGGIKTLQDPTLYDGSKVGQWRKKG